jgi:alkanesulfonate monooxygenase SsuD/methylene tetrahydromethanopterin reductase-like flavin-dependent oxidoreductase (luciferase family)
MRFGARLPMLPPQDQWALVRRLEDLGFDSVWTGDHVSFHNPLYDSLTLLASYAPLTRRIRLGTAVYLLALRAPAIAAKVAATVDVLSGGRLIFGVGVGGENPKEFELCGVPHRERDTPATFRGRFTSFEAVSIDPKPVQTPAPPIWLGGRSDAALARAGRQGDGWVSYIVRPDRYAQSLERIRAAAHAAGRALDGFTAAHLAFVTVGRDYEQAKKTWVAHLSRRYAQDFEPLAKKYGVIGTPQQCAEQLAEFADAGCGYVIVDAIGEARDKRDQFEAIAADVIPRFERG